MKLKRIEKEFCVCQLRDFTEINLEADYVFLGNLSCL